MEQSAVMFMIAGSSPNGLIKIIGSKIIFVNISKLKKIYAILRFELFFVLLRHYRRIPKYMEFRSYDIYHDSINNNPAEQQKCIEAI